MKLKTYFNAALLCLAVSMFAACAGDNLADNKEKKQEIPQGVRFTINETKTSAKSYVGVEEDGAKTRTTIKHTPGLGADAYWNNDDYIWVKNNAGVWKKSISTMLNTERTHATFILPGNQSDYSDGCPVIYNISPSTSPSFHDSPEYLNINYLQPQTKANDFSMAGYVGDCGTGVAKSTGGLGEFSFQLQHNVSYLCFLPRCSNAALGQNLQLTKIVLRSTIPNDYIAANWCNVPSTGAVFLPSTFPSWAVNGLSSPLVTASVNNFPLSNSTAESPDLNATYIVILPGIHDFTITYTIKDKVTGIEAEIKKQANGVNCKAGEITDITAWIDKDLKGNHTNYYLWGAQEPLTKDAFQLAPGDPQAANQANTIPNALFSTLPNANELCWYAYKGDVHWGQSLDVYVVNGHLKHINGIWLKKKAKILADEHISASYMENGYPRFDNNVYKDWRNVFWEAGLPAAAYPNFIAAKTTPVPNTQDYFFLPLLGYNSWGTYISSVDDTAFYWSSSSPALQIAWVLDIYNHGVKVITATKYQAGYLVMPFQ
ncbi:hypothetical protein [Segatella oulorum]|uniref:hypothetical protein n=1 Tax=Segatella oulorum TaxID=28136 RepID=UPI0028F06FC3|nr:hypothetical protein [Segatella oulorum]